MAYEIGHKSHNECLIKYVVDDASGNNFWLELLVVALVVMALLAGTDLLIIFIGFIVLVTILKKAKPRRTSFEIELNRKKSLISVRSDKPGVAALRTYPLENFIGFGHVESRGPKTSKTGSLADLFLEFDDNIDERFISAKNSLLSSGELKTDPNGEIFWQVPIHKVGHHTPIANAEKIIAAVDSWLGPKAIDQGTDEPAPIVRDLRELEDGETKPLKD